MELQEFIKHSLTSIVNGIKNANKSLDSDDGIDRTFSMPTGDAKDSVIFDIAVTASSESEKSKGGGLKISVVDFGGKIDKKTTSENVSRIKFQIKPNAKIE
ncbi:hypothetical protein GQ568_00530 [Patescibacteria group bacterium]|nr:hypothetical protein [Patescibacteria group bacterium]